MQIFQRRKRYFYPLTGIRPVANVVGGIEDSAQPWQVGQKIPILLQAPLTKILLLLSLATPFDGIKYQENMITRVTEYLDQHTAEELSLDMLAQQFFVSKYYLCHAFRQQNGISVFSYLTAKRIAMAQQLMLKGESATSAAYRVGFRNYSSFYRAYLKQTGQAPIQCKKTIHKQEQS